MVGERNLEVLLAKLTANLEDDLFVFVTCPDRNIPQDADPVVVVHEREGTTLVLRKEQADKTGLTSTFPCRMITLDVHSALDAIGFFARVSTALADANIGVNPVAGFFHDHLFVPDGRQNEALEIISSLALEAQLRLQSVEAR